MCPQANLIEAIPKQMLPSQVTTEANQGNLSQLYFSFSLYGVYVLCT